MGWVLGGDASVLMGVVSVASTLGGTARSSVVIIGSVVGAVGALSGILLGGLVFSCSPAIIKFTR